MIDLWVNWFKSLTMEQTFVATGIGILVASIGLGLLVSGFWEKGGDDNDG